MNQELMKEFKADLKEFQEMTEKFYAKEVSVKDYKGFSGGFGSYAQKGGEASMLRLRMPGGRVTKEKLKFLVPSIDVYLPIYHGTDSESLEKGAGHLENSSLPVGGKGTHSIISAHTGLPSAKMFDNLTEVKEGDVFYIHVLNRTLAYEVDQIKVVLPENVSDLLIDKNKDYVTLVTCTPYGINSHRLLVRGTRIPYKEAKKKDNSKKKGNTMWKAYALMLVLAVVLIILLWYYFHIRPNKGKKRKNSRTGKKVKKRQVRRNEK